MALLLWSQGRFLLRRLHASTHVWHRQRRDTPSVKVGFVSTRQTLDFKRFTSTMAEAENKTCKIAVVQMCSTNDYQANFKKITLAIDDAKKRGAVAVLFPECFEFMGNGSTESVEFASRLTDDTFRRLCDLAKENDIWISYGGFHEKLRRDEDPEHNRIANAHVMVNNRGEIVANYRKAHLFDVDIPDGKFHESSFTKSGEKMVLIKDSPMFNVGLTTCYDLRFPPIYAKLRSAGADIILVPSAFMCSTGTAHWETLLRARAIETQCYIAAAAQVGKHNENRESYGHSIIVDPWGEIVARSDGRKEEVLIAELSTERLRSVRERMPIVTHLKPDLYASEVHVIDATSDFSKNSR